jgi:hypothetical protein
MPNCELSALSGSAEKRRLRISCAALIVLIGGMVASVAGPWGSSVATAAVPKAKGCPAATGKYAEEVLAHSPTAYYRLDERKGPTLCDSSPALDNGTYASSGITYHVDGALLNSTDKAVEANGSAGDIGQGGATSGLTGDVSFTYEGWFKSTATVQDQVLVDMGQSGTAQVAGLALWSKKAPTSGSIECGNPVTNSTLALDTFNSSNCWNTASVKVNLWNQQWHYVAITYDASSNTVTAYVDGLSLGAQTSQALNLSASPIRIGNWVDTVVNQPFLGSADEIAVYPSALSATTITAHYKASGRT